MTRSQLQRAGVRSLLRASVCVRFLWIGFTGPAQMMAFERGVTALVGGNGASKTALLRVLARLFGATPSPRFELSLGLRHRLVEYAFVSDHDRRFLWIV